MFFLLELEPELQTDVDVVHRLITAVEIELETTYLLEVAVLLAGSMSGRLQWCRNQI